MMCLHSLTGGAVISQFSCPWMPPVLQPNCKLHWSKKVKPRAKYKRDCWAVALEAKARRWRVDLGNHSLRACLRFHPPTNGRRDLDNCLAAFKAGIDGIAAACGVDDSLWALSIAFGPAVKGGAVVVTIRKDEGE